MRTDPNRISRFNTGLREALEDGRVTRNEARTLGRQLRSGGITGAEQSAVRNAYTRHRDAFEPGAARTLGRAVTIGDFDSPALVRNGFRVALADDGRIDRTEARDIIRNTQDAAFTRTERRELARQFDRHRDAFVDGADLSVQRYLEATLHPPEDTRPRTIRVAGLEVRTHGASPEAVAELRRVINTVLEARPGLRERLREKKVSISIVPADKKLTDLPELRFLRDQRSPDGRPWKAIRGATAQRRNGETVVAITEENLANLASDVYRGRFSLAVHELAHAIQDVGISERQRREIRRLFQERRDHPGRFVSTYARTNEREFFAEVSAAYFDRGAREARGADFLRERDPELYRLLAEIYGPARAA